MHSLRSFELWMGIFVEGLGVLRKIWYYNKIILLLLEFRILELIIDLIEF
jgi:hypothetical protein